MSEDVKKAPENKEAGHVSRPVDSQWGEEREDNFGYASDEERREKRGLEDWELVDKIPESQNKIPKWFIGVIVAVAFVAVSLSFPFFGLRKDMVFNWGGWGMGVIAAVIYLSVMGVFVAFMVRLYGSRLGGRLDSDKEKDDAEDPKQ